jgi:hypothetical protein
VSHENAERVLGMARQAGVPAARLGAVGGANLTITTARAQHTWPLSQLHDLWFHSIARAMQV